MLKDFATTVRDDVFAPTPSPLSVRGLLLYAAWFDLRRKLETCKQTHPVKCSLDLRKDKNVIGDHDGAMNGKQ